MKVCTIFFVLFYLSLTAHAESVSCASEDGKWKVSMDLTAEVASNISFEQFGAPYRSYNDIPVNSYRMRFPEKLMVYEMSFLGIRYMIINRAMNGKVPANYGTAEFLLTNNPVGFAQWVDCKFQ